MKKIENVDFQKAFLFVPKPDDFLKKDGNIAKYYRWVTGIRNAPYIDVVEGNYYARPINNETKMDINDNRTYYKVEKGTDVNLAIFAISKAFYNAYDVAFIMSGDTDYLKVYETLQNIGKIVIVVDVKGQNLNKIRKM